MGNNIALANISGLKSVDEGIGSPIYLTAGVFGVVVVGGAT